MSNFKKTALPDYLLVMKNLTSYLLQDSSMHYNSGIQTDLIKMRCLIASLEVKIYDHEKQK